MGLREDIEAALAQAAADRGVRQLAVDGDEKIWVAGVASVDGALEVRVGGDRGPRRGLRRTRPDRATMEALGFRNHYEDAWTLPLPPGPRQAGSGAAAAVSAMRALGVRDDACAEVFFSQRGARDLVAAVEALAGGTEHVVSVDTGRSGPAVATLYAVGDRIRVFSIWPDSEPLELPGFELDRDQQASKRDVHPDEAVAAVHTILDAHPAGAERPMFVHFGA